MANNQTLKYVSLVLLVVQITAHVLTMRYSLTVEVKGQRYLPSTVVVVCEVLKVLACLAMLYFENGRSMSLLWQQLREEVLYKPVETSKLAIPALLYTVQNNLLFVALSNLDAATYQVTYQLKILTTALFAVLILGKSLSATKWLSLVILTAGVALVQYALFVLPMSAKYYCCGVGCNSDVRMFDKLEKYPWMHDLKFFFPTSWPSTSDSPKDNNMTSEFVGITAVLLACCSSGFAGIYFEKLLKFSNQSLWIRNIQLAIFGMLIGFASAMCMDYQEIVTGGFLQGYTYLTCILVFLQAFGGLIVASVVKYADNILKGFAAAISIILQSVISYYVLDDFNPSTLFFIGTPMVLMATLLYGYDGKSKSG